MVVGADPGRTSKTRMLSELRAPAGGLTRGPLFGDRAKPSLPCTKATRAEASKGGWQHVQRHTWRRSTANMPKAQHTHLGFRPSSAGAKLRLDGARAAGGGPSPIMKSDQRSVKVPKRPRLARSSHCAACTDSSVTMDALLCTHSATMPCARSPCARSR
eukprot:352800-Chlamydomonas_euryale.AAC.11